MRVDNWKIYDKKGSPLNTYVDSFLNLEFVTDTQNSLGAEAYAITDTSAIISEVVVTNSGWEYPPSTDVKLTYSFGDYEETLTPVEASINFVDVSIFNPDPTISNGIGSVPIDVSTEFIYPSVIYAGAVFMNPVSVELVETEHLSILEEASTGALIRPFDPINGTLVFQFSDGDPEIKLFELSEDAQTVDWSEELIFDVSNWVPNTPLIVNIGFRSEDEGVFERKLRVYHRVAEEDFQVAEILVNAQSIGPDERFDILAQDFGLPNSKEIPHLFKRADINEAMPDWELVNYKGKHMVLEHDQIMPYIGTYKALINAIKWLGYEDIKVKEWFKNVKENKKLSLYVPYEAEDRTRTILYFTPDERKNLKKLNELSLVYCITRETGEIDAWGNPLVEECYEYNINEILIKLKALKEWLEKNIIGVNARITDVTGEGIYLERYRNIIYSTQNVGNTGIYTQSLTPIAMEETSELIAGDSSIKLSLLEITQTEIQDMEGIRLRDLLQYYWDPSNGAFSEEDASALWWDPSTLFVGPPFKYPFYNLGDIQWRASVENTDSGVLGPEFVSKPLWVYDNELRFYNILDVSSAFYEASTNIAILVEQGYLRDASNDIWTESIHYSFYQDPSEATRYIMESSTGAQWISNGIFNIRPNTSGNSRLEYGFDDNYKAPLLKIQDYKFVDASGTLFDFGGKVYNLDLIDGKIRQTALLREPSSLFNDPSVFRTTEYYINWNYDTSLLEQKITLNVVYESPRGPLYLYDPSIYYHTGAEAAAVIDNSVYDMLVNHIGPYEVEIFGWDGGNVVYRNYMKEPYEVWTKFPTIWSYLDTSCGFGADPILCPSAYLSVADISALVEENLYPVFDRQVPLQGLTLEQDTFGEYYIQVPSISYFVDLPDPGSLSRFYNMTERVTLRSGDTFTVDPDFQWFNEEDDVNLVLFDRGQYYFIEEVSGYISGISGDDLTITGIPAEFVTDSSTEVYLLNDTRRETYYIENDLVNKTVDIDISTGDPSSYFIENQLVGILIDDFSTGYTWGSSFRVLDVSLSPDPSLFIEGTLHTLQGNIPEFILEDPSRYTITAKHAFSTFADFNIPVDRAQEIDNTFHLYLEDTYFHQYYLDSTFVYVNVLFDQEKVLDQWYDPSTDFGLVTGAFYPYTNAITVDISTLVILDAIYDTSGYMLNQKNLWTVRYNDTKDILFRVYNNQVPYIFNETGLFDVQVEAYDSYGNLKLKDFEGLINVVDE